MLARIPAARLDIRQRPLAAPRRAVAGISVKDCDEKWRDAFALASGRRNADF
jgi:hypothetical protein